jgi:hypothetical protein
MNKLLSLVALGACLSFGVAQAQVPAAATTSAKPVTAQQGKMASCNTEATGKKGEERKDFMKSCLSSKPAVAPMEEKMSPQKMQQNKMKTCNADAKTKALKGEERKDFMKNCLKKS